MNASLKCPSCGAAAAAVTGLICEHCGRLTASVDSVRDENRALDEFHNLIHQLARDFGAADQAGKDHEEEIFEKSEKAAQILRTGFIPDHKEVLLDAGVYCLQLMRSHYELEEAARSRLESIITKLKLMPQQDEQIVRAVKEFEGKIKELKEEQKMNDRFLFTCAGLVAVVILTAVILAFLRC